MSEDVASKELPAGHRVGRYTIVRPLGRGGMGVVYVARDDRLQRDVALKMIAGLRDEATTTRFWREARAAASINHPHVCQLYEVDETPDGIYLAMELLDGEPLDKRLDRGALPPTNAVAVACDLLSALGALHDRGFVHRDVKPSNVFLTPHGAKLLDFGLARTTVADTVLINAAPRDDITAAGVILGTPRYMAPEQVGGESVDGRADLYAAGAVLFEMLSGRPPFIGHNLFDLMYAALHEQPPALQGPPEVVAIDRVIRRAMAKDPSGRFSSATTMVADLQSISLSAGVSGAIIPVRALTRLVVPPLRLTKPDAEIDFLSFGLAEAVTGSLASLADVVVRSPAVAAKWNVDGADPRKLAATADVDLVLSGSLLRSGQQLRATVQLIDATTGTVIASENVRGTADDIFALEDALSQTALGLVSQRSGAPTPPPEAPRRDVPANAQAFEAFLRGSDYARDPAKMALARESFEAAVRDDPGFAPAWANLGRCHRFIGKFVEDRAANIHRAEEALKRSLALSPNLPAAHRYLTHLESEEGRADAAIERLLKQARVSRNDANIFAGLVHACRYAGLVDESIAAHEEARRLDPTLPTSVEYTIALTADATRARRMIRYEPGSYEAFGAVIATQFRFQSEEFMAALNAMDTSKFPGGMRRSFEALRAIVRGQRDEAIAALHEAAAGIDDPEAWYMYTIGYARIGAPELGIPLLARVVDHGFTPTSALESDIQLDPLRGQPGFPAILERAKARTAAARAVFELGGGPALLGLSRR